MRKFIRKVGLRLLQWSGMEIPEHLMDNILTPFVIEYDYEYDSHVPASYQSKLFDEGQERIWSYARKYIGSTVEKKDGFTKVTQFLVVQRPVLPPESESSKE